MKHYICAIFRRCLGIIKLFNIKIFNKNNLIFSISQNLSLKTKIKIEKNAKVMLGKRISTRDIVQFNAYEGGKIYIGNNCFFNGGCRIDAMQEIYIGNNTIFGPNVVVYDHDHSIQDFIRGNHKMYEKRAVNIGENCWIGTGVIILKGVTIGNNVIIGAGTIVTKDIESNRLVMNKREITSCKIDLEEI